MSRSCKGFIGHAGICNLVLLCPNHHTVVHKTDATFDYSRLTFCFPNSRTEPLCLNSHLSPRVEAIATHVAPPQEGGTSPGPQLASLSRLIVSQLTPDLLSPEWAALSSAGSHPFTGYCYVASEALYHLGGGAAAGLSVYRCALPRGGTHWWLVDSGGHIIDPTAAQFVERPPYEKGIRTHFLSQKPSRRASQLIAKVQAQFAAS
jgi:hypothetical protein